MFASPAHPAGIDAPVSSLKRRRPPCLLHGSPLPRRPPVRLPTRIWTLSSLAAGAVVFEHYQRAAAVQHVSSGYIPPAGPSCSPPSPPSPTMGGANLSLRATNWILSPGRQPRQYPEGLENVLFPAAGRHDAFASTTPPIPWPWAGRDQAGNPSLSAVAEAVKVFTGLMNTMADKLGLTGSHFSTPDGYHADDHCSAGGYGKDHGGGHRHSPDRRRQYAEGTVQHQSAGAETAFGDEAWRNTNGC